MKGSPMKHRSHAPSPDALGADQSNLPSPIKADLYRRLDPKVQAAYRPVDPRYERLPRFCWVLYGIAAVCLVLYIVQGASVAFSDWFNRTISAAGRTLLATLTNWLPFSLGEFCIFMLPVGLGLALWYAIRHRCDTWRTAGVYVGILLSVVVSIFSVFVLNFSAGYRGSTLDVKLGLSQEKVSAEELYDTAVILIDHINQETENIAFYPDDFSIMPYSIREMNQHLNQAFEDFAADKDFINHTDSYVKPVLSSEVLSYMHITGVYSFFTGEANINVGFPDYTIPYTAAHEMAHQRGIARENEANFVAFLVCIGSEDSYVRYSAYLNMYEYVANALYSADKELYYKAVANLNSPVRAEMSAYNRFYDKYKESTASKVSGTVNNSYLQSQGEQAGIRSYGMVVDLAVAYFHANSSTADD